MNREKEPVLVSASAVTLRLDFGDVSTDVGCVITGGRLIMLVDEFPLQKWCKENAESLLQYVSAQYGPVKDLRIYADTHK